MHFHGTQIQRPVHPIFKGRIFDQVDRAAYFVLGVNHSVGTRALSTQAPLAYEIPPEVTKSGAALRPDHGDNGQAFELVFERRRQFHRGCGRQHRGFEALVVPNFVQFDAGGRSD
jgi:ATP-dependent DNA helicase RecG